MRDRNATLSKMRERLEAAQGLVNRNEYSEARAEFVKLATELQQLGLRSANVLWGLAVVADYLGDPREAITRVEEALELDPLAVSIANSKGIILNRIRSMLSDVTRAPDDPTTPSLYELLLERGEADVDAHLAMARFYKHAGHHADALRVLSALTTLYPRAVEAWVAIEEAARAAGNSHLAEEAAIQVKLLGASLGKGAQA
ncbi:MAG: tetratricopeptide repeat protein [Deltaproteobacteria bacterium]|nr:tetratricopeptide repeat protein [Deltaproteobacteria bacterium]